MKQKIKLVILEHKVAEHPQSQQQKVKKKVLKNKDSLTDLSDNMNHTTSAP